MLRVICNLLQYLMVAIAFVMLYTACNTLHYYIYINIPTMLYIAISILLALFFTTYNILRYLQCSKMCCIISLILLYLQCLILLY